MTNATLARSAPEAQGISSRALGSLLDALDREVTYLHSLIVIRHGHVVAEGYWRPYDARTPHMLFSLSKSFTASAIGMLVEQGKLSVDDRVLDFFPDEAPSEASPRLRAMRVRHLLTMTSGHGADPTRPIRQSNVDWVRGFFAAPLLYEPGEHFVYNSGATYVCSAIAQKLTGQRLLDFLGPRLFEPLGFAQPTWERSPQGIDTGGWGLRATTAEIARFGQLYLQKGAWQGRQLIPEAWVDEATSARVPNATAGNPSVGRPEWEQGYGYQFWRCRHGAYRGDGAHGQFCLVLPEQDAVVATTAGTPDLQQILDLFWEHLLPHFGSAPLPSDRAAADALASRLRTLTLPTPTGSRITPASIKDRVYAVETNEGGIDSLAFTDDAVVVRSVSGEQRIPVGHREWARGTLALPGFPAAGQPASAAVAAAGGWTDERTFVLHLWSYETPWRNVWTCRFEDERLRIEREQHPPSPTSTPPAPLEARALTPVA